jgi:hypothetical protein
MPPSRAEGAWIEMTDLATGRNKPCAAVPCPSFTDQTLEIGALCICHDLQPGQLYKPGCEIHDPAMTS